MSIYNFNIVNFHKDIINYSNYHAPFVFQIQRLLVNSVLCYTSNLCPFLTIEKESQKKPKYSPTREKHLNRWIFYFRKWNCFSFARAMGDHHGNFASSLRKIFPVTVFGMASMNWTPPCKYLYFDTFPIKLIELKC